MIKTPTDYRDAAVIARMAGDDLLAQLSWMAQKPAVILDVGSGIGEHSLALKQHYPQAEVFALDTDLARLEWGKGEADSTNIHWLCADGNRLPFPNQSVDFIFANFFLAWQPDIIPTWQEWRRVLRPDGLLMFNLFGPDTLKEGQTVFRDSVVPGMIDIHDVGDMLLQQGFCEPVLSVDYYTLSFSDKMRFFQELYHSDMILHSKAYPDIEALKTEDGKWPATFEVVSGHAFAASLAAQKMDEEGIVRIPLSAIGNRLQREGKR